MVATCSPSEGWACSWVRSAFFSAIWLPSAVATALSPDGRAGARPADLTDKALLANIANISDPPRRRQGEAMTQNQEPTKLHIFVNKKKFDEGITPKMAV